jgi:hypothetical protein
MIIYIPAFRPLRIPYFRVKTLCNPKRSAKSKLKLYVLCRNADGKLSFQEPQAFASAAFAEISNMARAEDVYAFARRNRSTLLQLRNMGKDMERLAFAVYLVMIARASTLSTW